MEPKPHSQLSLSPPPVLQSTATLHPRRQEDAPCHTKTKTAGARDS